MELETEWQNQNHQEQEGQLSLKRKCELLQPQAVVEDIGNICNKYPVRNTLNPAISVNADRTVNMEINSAKLSIAQQPATVVKPKTKSKKLLKENQRLKNTVVLQKARIKKLQSKLQKMEATVTKLENTIDEKLEDLVEKKLNQRWAEMHHESSDSSKCNQLTSSDGQATLSTSSQESKKKSKKIFEMKVCKYCILEEKTLDNVVKTYTNGSQIDELKLEKCYSHEHRIQSSNNKFKRQPSFMMVAKVVFKLCGNNIKTLIVSADIGKTFESCTEWYQIITYLLTMMPNLEEFYFEEPVWSTNANYQNIRNGTEKAVMLKLQNLILHVVGHESESISFTAMDKASNSFLQQLEAPNLKSLLIKYKGREREESVLLPIYKLVANYQASLHALELQNIELVHLDQFPKLPCLKTLKIELKFDAMTDNPNQIQAMLLPLQDLEHLEVIQRHYYLAKRYSRDTSTSSDKIVTELPNVGVPKSKSVPKRRRRIKLNDVHKRNINDDEMVGGGYSCAPGCYGDNVQKADKARFKKIESVFIKELWKSLPKLKTVVIIFFHVEGLANTKHQANRS